MLNGDVVSTPMVYVPVAVPYSNTICSISATVFIHEMVAILVTLLAIEMLNVPGVLSSSIFVLVTLPRNAPPVP